MELPLVGITASLIGEDTHVVGVGYDDGTVDTAKWTPYNIWRGVGRDLVVDDERDIRVETKFEWAIGQDIVDRIEYAKAGLVSDRSLVNENPFVDGLNMGDVGHARAGIVFGVSYIVDYRTPIDEVGGYLMAELLAMQRVPLVGIVGNNGVFVWHEHWLPYRGGAVRGISTATRSDIANKFPSPCTIRASIQVNSCEVGSKDVTSRQDRSRRKPAEWEGKVRDSRLSGESDTSLGVVQVRYVSP